MTDLLADRYGTNRRLRTRLVVVFATVLVLGGLVWLGWAIWGEATPKVQSQLQSFDVVDAHQARAVVTVRLSQSGVKAHCQLQAFATDHTIVGDLSFTPPSGEKTSTTTQVLRTERLATSVELTGCTAPGQKRPR